MNIDGNIKGLIIFGVIMATVTLVAFLAYEKTGAMGIEERYNQAVGLSPWAERESRGGSGFSVEGSPVLYLVILSILAIICIMLYRRFIAHQAE